MTYIYRFIERLQLLILGLSFNLWTSILFDMNNKEKIVEVALAMIDYNNGDPKRIQHTIITKQLMTNKFETSRVNVLLLVLLSLFLGSCSDSDNNSPSDSPVTIGISWRSDLDSEFYTNVVTAIKECGATPVLLTQVKCNDITYQDGEVTADCIDEAGHLTLSAASTLRASVDNSNAGDAVKSVDAVIFTGGEDVSPTLLANPQPWHGIEAERDYNATRDVNDYTLMAYCLKQDISLLGFCRGMQMLGVISGATVIQDIPTFFAQRGETYDYIHRNEKSSPDAYRDYSPHDVTVVKGTKLYDMAGELLHNVPSWHHQALLSVEGTPLVMSGYTIVNGMKMIEAIERTDKTLAMGFQFHPEAAIVKHCTGAANKDRFMSMKEAKNLISSFITLIKTRKASKPTN